ncbi:unnamed protein product [Symbiodinium sp. CCMP2592]|nr:unnamed protein product [Symbiodinium sp. CCMP2592]
MNYKYMLVASYTMPVLKGRKCHPDDKIMIADDGGVGMVQVIQVDYQTMLQNPQAIQVCYQTVLQNPQAIQVCYQTVLQNPQAIQASHQIVLQNPQAIQAYGDPPDLDLDELFVEEEDVPIGVINRFPDGSFVISLHLKDQLVDTDGLMDLVPREVELPVPERKAKRMLKNGDMDVAAILNLFELLKIIKVKQASGRAAKKGISWTTGMFVHGGVAGLRGNTKRMRWTTRCLVESAKKMAGDHAFTAVGILENKDMDCHKDRHNEVDSMNTVIMLKRPLKGGELWLENDDLSPEEADWKQVSKKLWKKGEIHDLPIGQPYVFSPRKWYEVQPWDGDRVVMVLYNPRASHLHFQDKDDLDFVGFPTVQNDLEIPSSGPTVQNDIEIPGSGLVEGGDVLSQLSAPAQASEFPLVEGVPELDLIRPLELEDPEELDDYLISLTEEQDHLLQDLQDRSSRLRLLLEEEQALLEECKRAGQDVTDEVEHVTVSIEDMIQEVVEKQGARENEAHDRLLKATEISEEDLEGDLEVARGRLDIAFVQIAGLRSLLLSFGNRLVRAEGNIEEARGEVARTILNFNGRLESVEDSLEEGLENQAGLLRVFSQIFDDATTRLVPLVARPSDVRLTMEEASVLPSSEEASRSSVARFRSSSSEVVFLKHAVTVMARKVRLCDEDIFELHVQRFELILAHSYEASILGRSFRGATLEERHTKVRLALGGKAPRTLQKRYGQSAKLVSWAELESVKAFPIDGQIAEEFLRHLVSSSGRHSVLTGAVECFAFLHHVLGVDMELNACSNPIVQGILRKARLERPAKKQARALLASEVLALEALLADECRPLIDRFCAGAFLFALYGRARLGDLRVLDCFITDLLEDSASGCGYLEVLSLSHKCRSTSNSQGMRMHILVPAKGIGPRCWGKDFISVARELGRDLTSIASGEPLLYMPDAHGNFSNVPADTDRFAAWVQDLLSTVPAYSGDKISGHSAKATPLSWMGKAGTDFDTQTLLGHHVLVGRSSALTYARDTQAAPVRKFEALIGDVRRGVFLPDSTRSGHMSSAFPTSDEGGPEPVFAFPPSPPPQLDDSLTPFPMPGFLDQAGQDPEGEADADWLGERDWYLNECLMYRHKTTRTVHLLPAGASSGRFVCGREWNQAIFKPVCGSVSIASLECKQCYRGRSLRDLGALNHALEVATKKARVEGSS